MGKQTYRIHKGTKKQKNVTIEEAFEKEDDLASLIETACEYQSWPMISEILKKVVELGAVGS